MIPILGYMRIMKLNFLSIYFNQLILLIKLNVHREELLGHQSLSCLEHVHISLLFLYQRVLQTF